jgi:hypothetical protein
MKTGDNKGKSKLSKKTNRHHKIMNDLQEAIAKRNDFITQTNLFIKKLLSENRVTKDELRVFYKPYKKE